MTEVLRWELDASQLEGSLRSASQSMDATRTAAGDLGDEMDKAMVKATDGAGEATEAVDDLGKQTEDSGTKGTEAGVAFGAAFKAVAAGAAIAAAAIAGIALAAVDLSADANQIAKQAAVVGETSEDFQILQGVFDLMTDGSVNAQMALVKLNKGLDDASAGIGPAAESLERLGLSAEDLIPLSAIERITVIGDEIGKMDNRAAQTITAMDLLGRAGFALVPAMAAGGDAIRAAAAEFESAGVISNELAAESEKLQDAILLSSQAFASLKAHALEPLIPVLTEAANGFRDLFVELGKSGAVDELTEAIDRLAQSVFQVDTELGVLDATTWAVVQTLTNGINTLTLMNEAFGLLPNLIIDAVTGSDRFTESLRRCNLVLDDLLEALFLLDGETLASKKNLERGVPSVVALTDAMKNLEKAGADASDSLDDVGGAAKGAADDVDAAALTQLVDLQAVEDSGEALTAAAEEIAEQTKGIWADYYAAINAMEEEAYQLKIDHARDLAAITLQSTADAFGGISSLADGVSAMLAKSGDEMTEKQKKQALDAWAIGQQTAAAQAVISGALAIAAAATTPFPGTIPAVIAAAALAAGTVLKIESAQPPKLHTGGLFDNEVPVIGQRGESMNSRLGTKVLGEEGLRAVNRGEGIGGSLTVINKVNNRTTNVASHEAIRTRSGELYDETVRTTQPKSGTRVPTWGRG